MATPSGSVVRVARLRLLLPFALMTLLAVMLATPNANSRGLWEYRVAGGLTLALVVLGFAVPWRRLPTWTHPVVPLGYFVVIAFLRDANGGAASGYGPLCVMPVFWLALFGSRRQLAIALAAVAALFTAPIVFVGGARYPASEWRALLLWTFVLTIVGYRTNALVRDVKRRARLAREHATLVEQHATELADTQASLQAMAQLAREVSSAPNARDLICEAAMTGSGAALATLVEPDGQGGFSITGTAGIADDLEHVRAEVRPNASLRAFYARERLFIPDTSDHAGLSPFLIERAGVQSVVFEPILRHEQPVGVLCVGWNEARAELDTRTSTVISYLAAEAGAAIERADFVAQLDELARTDQLTDLPNRRSWIQHLQDAVDAHRGRSGEPFCVAVLDLDHFKHYNDRYGHQAGDALLADVATAWRGQLRGNDVIARYGGEEFAVLLPACSLDEASHVLERMRLATPSVTCSAGLAEHRPDETAEELTRRADRALYLAKRSGRNQLIAA